MIDRLFERLTRAIELLLALAFIAAVLLNFANVVGRYVLGWTIPANFVTPAKAGVQNS